MPDRMKLLYTQSIQTQIACAELLPEALDRAAELLTHSVLNGQRVFVGGHGGAAAIAQLFAHYLTYGHGFERPPFPAILLPATLNTTDTDTDSLARPVSALGQAHDILVVCSAEVHAPALTRAMEAALSRDMIIVALTGDHDQDIAGLLGPEDVEIRVPATSGCRVTEQLLFAVHALCEAIERTIFPQEDDE